MNASAKPTVRRSAVEICASTINTAITNPSLTGVRGIRSQSLIAASAIAIPVVWGIARMADGPLKVTKPALVNKLQPRMQVRRPTSTYELIAVTVKKFISARFLTSLCLYRHGFCTTQVLVGTVFQKGSTLLSKLAHSQQDGQIERFQPREGQATCVQRSGVDASGVRVDLGAATKHNRRMCAPPGS